MTERKETGAAEERPAQTGTTQDASAERQIEEATAANAPEDAAPGGEGPGPDPAESQEKPETAGTPEEKLRALRKERDAIYERWLRSAADLENYRKRMDREREEFRRAAIESIGIEMIQVLDNFDRAMSAIPPGAPPALVAGIRLIHKQILDLLARRGLVPMEKAEGPFDPHRHEAVATEIREDVPPHHVLEEIQRGYVLQGRVLRPALVKVSVRAGEESPPAGEAT